jgi:hypothetical protein
MQILLGVGKLVPWVPDESPGFVCREVLRHEEAGVEALDVLEGFRRVTGDGGLRQDGVGCEEPRHRTVEDIAIEIVRSHMPFRQEDRGDRVAANDEKVVLDVTTY